MKSVHLFTKKEIAQDIIGLCFIKKIKFKTYQQCNDTLKYLRKIQKKYVPDKCEYDKMCAHSTSKLVMDIQKERSKYGIFEIASRIQKSASVFFTMFSLWSTEARLENPNENADPKKLLAWVTYLL